MSRILLVTSPEKGHLNPMVGVAQWLLDLGHHVGWLCLPEPSPQIEKLGVEIVRLGSAQEASPHELVTGGAALASLVRDGERLRAWIRTLLLDNTEPQLPAVREAISGFAPDAVGSDGMQYAAVIACEQLSLPWAGLSSALTLFEPSGLDYPHLRNVRALADARAALFQRQGVRLSFRTCEALSPRLNTIFATRALVGGEPLPENTELVGPSIPRGARGDEVPFEVPSGRPLVYASFGSQVSWQPELFRALAEATAPLGVTLLATVGELIDTPFVRELPAHVVPVRYAPQREVLRRAEVFVSHGGANSVMEAMTAGVPLLLLPICNDQLLQAHFVERAGVGLALDSAGLDVERARKAIAELLGDSPFAKAARAVAADYSRHDGARTVAERLAGLAA